LIATSKRPTPKASKSAAREIDAIIKKAEPWKRKKLAQLRTVIKKADPAVIEEVKWKMPSKPEGVAVWTHDGIICHADLLKNAVRLTFHKGPELKDAKKLFNTRLDSKAVRAIDFFEEDKVDEAGLTALVREAVRVNTAKARDR
jgi:hypothetical protein